MLPIVLMMLVILVVAGVVVLYAAYPSRGEDVPRFPWIGKVLRRGVDAMPTIDDEAKSRH